MQNCLLGYVAGIKLWVVKLQNKLLLLRIFTTPGCYCYIHRYKKKQIHLLLLSSSLYIFFLLATYTDRYTKILKLYSRERRHGNQRGCRELRARRDETATYAGSEESSWWTRRIISGKQQRASLDGLLQHICCSLWFLFIWVLRKCSFC